MTPTALLLLATLAMCASPGLDAEAPGQRTVYVSRNGTSYHEADCPRLHFPAALSLEEARRTLRPCPVCRNGHTAENTVATAQSPPVSSARHTPPGTPHGASGLSSADRNESSTPAHNAARPAASHDTPVVAAVLADHQETTPEPAAAAPPRSPAFEPVTYQPRTEEPRPRRGGKHRTMGLVLGTVVGGVIGLPIAWHVAVSAGGDEWVFASICAATAVIGGLAGYSLAGGFGDRVDASIARDRERLRDAQARSR